MPLSQSSVQNDSSASSTASALFCGEDAGEVVSGGARSWTHNHQPSLYENPPADSSIIAELIESEPHHMPLPDHSRRCKNRSVFASARQDSINWILKVHDYYHFSPVTALLSVNYMDRFLSSNRLPRTRGWAFQLLSVACLSLAAKIEEPEVPLLLDLQVMGPRFVFRPKSIEQMELRVLATLNWRLRSVTPFDYLYHFIYQLPSGSTRIPEFLSRVLNASSDLVLGTIRVADFMEFTPSTIAAAAVLCAADEDADVFFHEKVKQEMVRSCHQLMDTCPSFQLKELRMEPLPAPPSPVGVLDAAASGSSDTRSENRGSTRQSEPLPKRLRSSAPDVQRP